MANANTTLGSCSLDTFFDSRLPVSERGAWRRNTTPRGYRQYGFVELLTPDGYNPKLKKGRARGYSSAILHLAPANLSGYEVCNDRSDGCTFDCLNLAGHGGIALDSAGLNAIQRARIARTVLLFRQREVFFRELVLAIETHCRRAWRKGLTPVVRLNGTSDLPWERMPFTDVDGTRYATVFDRFPGVQFYDYTKSPARAVLAGVGAMPANYQLTFSRAEHNEARALGVLAAGGNVAVVFSTPKGRALPSTWHGYVVVDGDLDDLRFLDPHGIVVGLRAKGARAKHDASGFVVRADDAACDYACYACDECAAGSVCRDVRLAA